MVVHIKNPTSPIIVDTEIKQNRHNLNPKYLITLLEKSNHFGNIRKILQEITKPAHNPENDDFENQMELRNIAKKYKQIILEMVDSREHITDNITTIKKIAHSGGYLREVEALDAKPKIYGRKDNKALYVTSQTDLRRDLGVFDTLIIDTNEESIFLQNVYSIKHYDVIKCHQLAFARSDLRKAIINTSPSTNIQYHSSHIDLSHLEVPANSITLETSTTVEDRENRNAIHFQARNVTLISTSSLRKEILDFSQTENVRITDALYNVEELILKPGSTADLKFCRKFPKKMDLSMCKEVYLQHSDLSDVSEITFKDEEQKNRFLQGSKTNNRHIKCNFTNPGIPQQIYNSYLR